MESPHPSSSFCGKKHLKTLPWKEILLVKNITYHELILVLLENTRKTAFYCFPQSILHSLQKASACLYFTKLKKQNICFLRLKLWNFWLCIIRWEYDRISMHTNLLLFLFSFCQQFLSFTSVLHVTVTTSFHHGAVNSNDLSCWLTIFVSKFYLSLIFSLTAVIFFLEQNNYQEVNLISTVIIAGVPGEKP